ncbi:MAG: hypothetical protein HGB05_12295 [Chloroflexi bacterium]|nr:hypothetical protein [Chloroflexota bacterium]
MAVDWPEILKVKRFEKITDIQGVERFSNLLPVFATQEYADYCAVKGYPTKVFFATGTCDKYGTAEERYQAYLKYEHIRNYVRAPDSKSIKGKSSSVPLQYYLGV